jgi:hypothetical protein
MEVHNKINETENVDMAPRTEMEKDGFFYRSFQTFALL